MVELTAQIAEARAQTDQLFRSVRAEALYDRPVPERHRLIFYLGHLEAFDWNQVARLGLSTPSFHPTFDRLFEAGIDPEPGKGPQDQPGDWPSVEEVQEYIREARTRVDGILTSAPPEAVSMALEHRLMHAETLCYLLHELPHDRKNHPEPQWDSDAPSGGVPGMAEVTGGLVTIGKDRDGSFGWDNEYDAHFVRVPAFQIDRYKVTNGDYLAFVADGARAPHFWTRRDGEWHWRGMFESYPLPLNSPVYVTHHEANAYANWRGLELPTEAQYHRAAFGAREGEERCYAWGSASPGMVAGNFEFRRFDPVAVDATPQTDSAFGVAQLADNGWEWTATPFEPFPGFQPSSTYPGYSANFFDGHHYVLKGASPRTASCFLRRSFRNWFRPDYPYAYASFRCVQC